jgi:hypothetical protein
MPGQRVFGVRGTVSEHERRSVRWVRYCWQDLHRDIGEGCDAGKILTLRRHHLLRSGKPVQTGMVHDDPHEQVPALQDSLLPRHAVG